MTVSAAVLQLVLSTNTYGEVLPCRRHLVLLITCQQLQQRSRNVLSCRCYRWTSFRRSGTSCKRRNTSTLWVSSMLGKELPSAIWLADNIGHNHTVAWCPSWRWLGVLQTINLTVTQLQLQFDMNTVQCCLHHMPSVVYLMHAAVVLYVLSSCQQGSVACHTRLVRQ